MTASIRGKVKLSTPATKDFVSAISMGVRSGMRTKSVVDADSPSHALLSLNGRKNLGRVLESDRSFT